MTSRIALTQTRGNSKLSGNRIGVGDGIRKMTEAERAYQAAREAINHATEKGAAVLDLSRPWFLALEDLPDEISGMKNLVNLYLSNTRVYDLRPLASLTGLQLIRIEDTKVSDLRPLAGLTGLRGLSVSRTKVSDLSPLTAWTELRNLFVSQTEVSDLNPLAGLARLNVLQIDQTKVSDLRPIRSAEGLAGTMGILSFSNTPATHADAELLRFSQIKDHERRGRETLDYLISLPPWPEPYTPTARGDGQPPRTIGAAQSPLAVRAAQAQIQTLLRNAMVTKVSAANFAQQIEDALRGVPATHGNELEPALQLMAEVAEVLKSLADDPVDDAAKAIEARLRLRIAQLEVIVERLTAELRDETAARKAAEALAKKEGFLQSYRKGLGTAAAAGTVGLIGVGVPTAAIYFLGVEHPLVQAFLTVMGRLPKS